MKAINVTKRVVDMVRVAVGTTALALLTVATPAAARLYEWNVCDDCHPGITNLSCGVLTLNAISGCCGMGNGSASCSNGTFHASCATGSQCHCNSNGDYCSPPPPPAPLPLLAW